MSCLGALFAVNAAVVKKIKDLPRCKRPDFISTELEEDYFNHHPDLLESLDKSWDAMHRTLTNGYLSFDKPDSPLGLVILGGELLYWGENERDYIITLKTPGQVAEIAAALPKFTKEECRRRYFSIPEEDYEFPLNEDDFKYTWEYLSGTIDFWQRAAEKNLYVLFTVDQ